MAYPTLGGLQLVAVESIVVTKESNLIPITFFGQDSDAAELFDMFGATRTVNIVGTWAGEKAALRTVVGNVDSMLSGSQLKTYQFSSDEIGDGTGLAGYINVKVMSFDYTWVLPGNKVNYSIKLYQGKEEL